VVSSPHLLLTYDFPPMGGGIARMMGQVARRYPASLTVSTGSHPDSVAADAVVGRPIHRVAVPSRRLRAVPGLVRWTRAADALAASTHPGLIWCGNFKPATYPARWIHQRRGTPYGVILHGTELLLLQHRLPHSGLKRGIARALLGPAAVLVANSRWTRDLCLQVVGQLGLKRDDSSVRVIPLGTDPYIFRPSLDTSAVRLRYGLPEGRWLLTVARLAAHKGIDTGLRVLGALRQEVPDLRYAVVGSGIGQAQLEALARQLALADRVRFLTGVPDVDLPALYNCAEIYLGLSRTVELMAEGFGISLSEASACGIPVVAGASGGIPDAVREGETGLLVDPDRPEPAIEAVRALLRDRELGRRLGAGGRRAVEQYYNWDRVSVELYRTGTEFETGS
jgi:phosphatidylinositol alpha-1,6-mannosyltransferase